MTTQDAMSLLYPVLTTAVFLNAVLLFLYWLMIRRTRQVLAHVSFFFTEFVVLLLLTLLTGSDPVSISRSFATGLFWQDSRCWLRCFGVALSVCGLFLSIQLIGQMCRGNYALPETGCDRLIS